jgi:Asp-tRNA(Asn)/Glu-tRNA(Gln) amidotransferase A subunit family amidase
MQSTVHAALRELERRGRGTGRHRPADAAAVDPGLLRHRARRSLVSNLARYDGVRYGHRAADAKGLRDLYSRSRAEGFGPK